MELLRHALGWHYPDLSEFEFRLVIPGRAVMKKNSNKVRKFGDRASIGPSGQYQRWERHAADWLATQWNRIFFGPIPKDVPIELQVVTYLPDRKGWPDLSATYEGPQDVLEAHRGTCGRGKKPCLRHSGVITNDSQIFAHWGGERLVDKEHPRTEITLRRFKGHR